MATREVYIAGSTMHPTAEWLAQIARNVTDCQDGFLRGKRFLIIDRDSIFSNAFTSILEGAGTGILRTAYQAPNMNAYAERFVRSIREECLDQMIFLGRASLERAITEYIAHCHGERSHQGIGNELPVGGGSGGDGAVVASERLGGLLKYYHREAV